MILSDLGVWEVIAGSDSLGNYLGTEFTKTTDVVSGQIYSFKIRAKNKWGWGTYTDPIFDVMAADVPYKVNIPVTSIDPTTGGVKIEW